MNFTTLNGILRINILTKILEIQLQFFCLDFITSEIDCACNDEWGTAELNCGVDIGW